MVNENTAVQKGSVRKRSNENAPNKCWYCRSPADQSLEPSHSVKPNGIARSAPAAMLIRSPPFTFLINKTAVISKETSVSKVLGLVKSPIQ